MSVREALLARAPKRETVEVDGVGSVVVQGLGLKERDDYQKSLWVQDGDAGHLDLTNRGAKLLVLCLRNEDGSRMFRDDEVGVIGNLDAAVLAPLLEVAERLSGMRQADEEEARGN